MNPFRGGRTCPRVTAARLPREVTTIVPPALDKPPIVWYIIVMKDKEPTYTLWHNGDLIDRQPHIRDTFDDMLEWAYGVDGTVEIFSSRDDLVWSSCDDSFAMTSNEQNECGMTDVEADADTLASAGYGTDEDYGYYGDDCYDY